MQKDIKPGANAFNDYPLGAQQSAEIQLMIINALTGYKKSRSKRIRLAPDPVVIPLPACEPVSKPVPKKAVLQKRKAHHKDKRIMTPKGVFNSATDAAIALDIQRVKLYKLVRSSPDLYYYIDK